MFIIREQEREKTVDFRLIEIKCRWIKMTPFSFAVERKKNRLLDENI